MDIIGKVGEKVALNMQLYTVCDIELMIMQFLYFLRKS